MFVNKGTDTARTVSVIGGRNAATYTRSAGKPMPASEISICVNDYGPESLHYCEPDILPLQAATFTLIRGPPASHHRWRPGPSRGCLLTSILALNNRL